MQLGLVLFVLSVTRWHIYSRTFPNMTFYFLMLNAVNIAVETLLCINMPVCLCGYAVSNF